jgi:hypothetical protein
MKRPTSIVGLISATASSAEICISHSEAPPILELSTQTNRPPHLHHKMAPRKPVTAKTQDKGKKRKADDNTSATQNPKHAKAATGDNATASTSKQPATCTQRQCQTTVMTEEEDAASHGDDAIHISSDEQPQESEAESSEAELGEQKLVEVTNTDKLTVLISNRMPTQKMDIPYLCFLRSNT